MDGLLLLALMPGPLMMAGADARYVDMATSGTESEFTLFFLLLLLLLLLVQPPLGVQPTYGDLTSRVCYCCFCPNHR